MHACKFEITFWIMLLFKLIGLQSTCGFSLTGLSSVCLGSFTNEHIQVLKFKLMQSWEELWRDLQHSAWLRDWPDWDGERIKSGFTQTQHARRPGSGGFASWMEKLQLWSSACLVYTVEQGFCVQPNKESSLPHFGGISRIYTRE